MDKYTEEELMRAVKIVSSTISRCEKAQMKFTAGTSSHTLLKNRIKALHISKALMAGDENIVNKYKTDELIEALKPISSIIGKCEKAKLRFTEKSSNYVRFDNIINAMDISKSLIKRQIYNNINCKL